MSSKIHITVPDDLKELLQEIADDTGDSLSSVTGKCIELGLVVLLEGLNKRQVYRKIRDERKERERKKNGQKTTDD